MRALAVHACVRAQVRTGRCMRQWDLGSSVRSVAWCPAEGLRVLSACAGNSTVLLPSGTGTPEVEAAARDVLDQVRRGRVRKRARAVHTVVGFR